MTRSNTGQLSETWTDVYSVGALISRTAYSKTSSQQREVAYEQLQLIIPYSTRSLALTTENSVVLYGNRYDIDEVDRNTEWRRNIILFVSERNQRGN